MELDKFVSVCSRRSNNGALCTKVLGAVVGSICAFYWRISTTTILAAYNSSFVPVIIVLIANDG